jgi:hypothetical protein
VTAPPQTAAPRNLLEVRIDRLRRIKVLAAKIHESEVAASRHIDPFEVLEYQPNCRVRQAAKVAGHPEWMLLHGCGECPQELFHAAREWDVLYGGAAGGGKTLALLMEGIRCAMRYPGLRVGAFRRSYPELEESLLVELANVRYGMDLGCTYDRGKHDLHFPNGSVVMFRYAETLADATKRQGGQYQLLLFDERTLTPPDVISFLESRLRSGDYKIPVLGIRSGTNPGGIGHGAVKDKYVDPTANGEHTVLDERGRLIRFIPSRLADNPHVNVEYARDLDALPEAMRAAFRDGSWTSFVGQVFSEWRHDRHVAERIAIGESWIRYAGMDYGWTAPSVMIWGARDGDGRLWLYREVSMRQTPEVDQAKRILGLEASDGGGVVHAADPAMWGKTGSAMPPAVAMALEGLALQKADNDRASGWQRIHSYLADGPACPQHREQGWATCPMVHVMRDACPDLVRTLPSLPYDRHRTEDVDSNGEDHWADALRYLVMAIGTTGHLLLDTQPEGRDPIVPAEQRMTTRSGLGWSEPEQDPDVGKVASSPWAT